MYQTQSKIKTQAQEIRWNRWQRLVANYPNSNKLKGLKDGEVQAELGKYYGVNDVTYWLDIPTIENWLKKQQRNFILVMSFSILCLLVWAGFEINIIVGVLGSEAGLSMGTILPIIAFFVAVILMVVWIFNRIKNMRQGNWKINVGKGR